MRAVAELLAESWILVFREEIISDRTKQLVVVKCIHCLPGFTAKSCLVLQSFNVLCARPLGMWCWAINTAAGHSSIGDPSPGTPLSIFGKLGMVVFPNVF